VEPSPVQLALKRRKQSPGKALEAGTNQVQVAPKKKNSRNLDRAAEAGASHSAGRTITTTPQIYRLIAGVQAGRRYGEIPDHQQGVRCKTPRSHD